MHRSLHTLAAAAAVLSFTAVGPAGCKGGRIAQCNSLINVINDEQEKHKNLKGERPEELKKLAPGMRRLAKKGRAA